MGQALVVASIVLVALWVAAPLFGKSRITPHYDEEKLNDLLERKEAVYRSILDLEYDFETGKAAEGDYFILRTQLETEAIGILRESDHPWAADDLELEIAAARARLKK